MPIGTQQWYFRKDAIRNPDWLYVFGDNVLRRGYGGQAKEMRGEHNAVGVATKNRPDSEDASAFFSEEPTAIIAQKRIIDQDMKPLFQHLVEGGVVIWPADGIGSGLSEMPKYAPTTFAYLESKYAAMCQISVLFQQKRYNEAKRIMRDHV